MFIFEKDNALSRENCEKLISLFEELKNFQRDGETIGGLNKNKKDCTEVLFSPNHPELDCLLETLQLELHEYEKTYPFLKNLSSFGQIENISLKRYYPGQAYHELHCERSTIKTCARILVWMLYLNDVHDGGETLFYHQKKLIKPKQGKLVIWPSEWTHAHKGLTSSSETKYIISSWLSFVS
jgi:hypothetical protein